MNGDAELPRRSSSPLKRRASGMDPEANPNSNGDVDMGTSQAAEPGAQSSPIPFPRAMSIDAPETIGHAFQRPPPILEQIKIIEMLLKAFAEAPVREGSMAYLVSRSWVDRALALRSDSKSPTSSAETSLGPVDNSDIIEEAIKDSSGKDFVRLKPGSGLESFELFPEDAWDLVMDWYGIKEGQEAIIRSAVNTADSKLGPPNIMSSTTHAQTFLKELKTLAGIPLGRRVRLFMVPRILPTTVGPPEPLSTLTPPDSPGRHGPGHSQQAWPNFLLDVTTFSQARDDSMVQVALSDHTANEKFNGQTNLKLYHLTTDQTLILDEFTGSCWVSNSAGRDKISLKSIPSRANMAALSSKPNSNRSSPARDGPITRGRAQKKRIGRSTGAVGLHNLGNTCYMNSALQCVRSVEELTKYFLTESYLAEINQTNVLGYEGRVAIAYGNLLREIYEEGRSAVSPRDFKSTVGLCRPTFSGWGQQDSQEFLGFLLDALQEDLSRIKNKPYIEKPDSTDDMVNNQDAIREMADKVWDITRRRDDSVIADLFTGMYKSTLKCPECGKISITFDPFNNLTLPLPLKSMWHGPVKFFPLNDPPVKIEVELPKHSTVEALKQFISDRTGVPVERLMGAEEFKDRFFKLYDNNRDISEVIEPADMPTMHELEAVPTNWPSMAPRQKYRSMLDVDSPLDSMESDDEQCQTMVVPVLHRRPQALRRGSESASPPHFITLTRKEASDLDMIQRKVLEKIATFSTWPKFSDASHEGENAESADADMVITTTSDADSSGDSKVGARSVEGEDDMVDVTVNGANNKLDGQSRILKRFSTRRPKFVDPEAFLDPELQNLFELCYFSSDSDGPVPTGWSSVDNTRSLPKLSERILDMKDTDRASPESLDSTGSGNDSSIDDENGAEASQTRMLDEFSDEDVSPAARFAARPGRPHQKFGAGGRKKFKGQKTYGKKGPHKRRDKHMWASKHGHRVPAVNPQPMPPAVADGGPLIRLHEGIVVDWNEEAWENVFGNTTRRYSPVQGGRTFVDVETLHDAGLKASQKRRETRNSRGITLEECLDEFERAEVLSEQDMWYCPRCKEHRRASKKFDLWKTPDILVAHLKRFSNSGLRRDKLDVLVDFPIEDLDLRSRVIHKDEGKHEVYDLIAVDDHYGGLGGGHYTAYAKNFVDGRWYSFNDSSVHVVSDATSVVTSAAYLLFYRRRSSGHLGGPRFAEILDRYEKETSRSDEGKTESGEDNSECAKAAMGQASGSDDDQLPLPDETIRRSIEDDGEGMLGNYQPLGSKSLSMTQAWSFNGLDCSGAEGSTGGECGSDDAQFDSSGDDRGREVFDQDTEMASGAAVEEQTRWDHQGVISVPAQAGSERDSDEVAEIHLEGDNKAGRVQ